MLRVKSKNKAEHKLFISNALTGGALFTVTGIMPLIVRGALRPIPPELHDLIGLTERADAFAYWKSWLLLIPAVILIFYHIGDWLTGGRRDFNFKAFIQKPPVVLALIYLFFVILSNIFSPYPYTALHGSVDRFEGVFAQIAYIVVFITALCYAQGQGQIRFIIAGLLFSSLVMGAVALSQILGHDFFLSPLGSFLVTGSVGKTAPKYTSVYGTLYNPNTMGLYASMLSPLLLLAGLSRRFKIWMRLPLIGAGLLMLAALAGSRSLGGLLGVAAAAVVILVTYAAGRVYAKKLPPIAVCIGIGVAAAFIVCACLFIAPVNDSIKRSFAKLQTALSAETKRLTPNEYLFEQNTLSVAREGTLLFTLSPAPDGFVLVLDGEGQAVPATQSETPQPEPGAAAEPTVFLYEVPGYGNVKLTRYPDYFVFDGFYLGVADGAVIAFRSSGLPIDMSKPVPAIGFKGYENWGSSRGYIWSRGIPLMLKHLILGSGSDSFINEFPQDDIVNKKYFLGNPYTVVDKAHNLYMQTGITTGGISMLALMALLAYYMGITFKSLVRQEGDASLFSLQLGVLAAVGAFAVSSLSTDSTLATTGVLYVILGLGYALNNISRGQQHGS